MGATEPIAWFVTPHGYGHAARACAIMEALHRARPTTRFHVFTRVPEAFFRHSLGPYFQYHEEVTDVGVVQDCPLREDVRRTAERLDAFLPFSEEQSARLADSVTALGCRLAVCDIAPIGITVAARAGVPSVLTENFTWHWIYRGYDAPPPALPRHADYLERVFELADFHVQTEPVCDAGRPHLTTAPVSRAFRETRESVRARLGIRDGLPFVLISMGGIRNQYDYLARLQSHPDVAFVVPDAGREYDRRGNLFPLPDASEFHHPDLVRAADAVVGKVGYSTISEIYHAGVPFGYVRRPFFREGRPLARYVEEHIPSLPIAEDAFRNGKWLESVPALLALNRVERKGPNGAGEAAAFIAGLLDT